MASNWFCKISGENIGPMSSKELKAMAEAGQLTPEHLVRRGKDGKWVPAIRVGGLFGAESEEDPPKKQVLNVTPGDDSHRTPPNNRKGQAAKQRPAARNRTPRPKRPIPTNAQRQAPEPAQAAANPFGIITDDSTPTSRVSGRSGNGGGTRRKKQQNTTLIIGSLGVLGLAAVVAIIVMVVQKGGGPPEQVAGQSGIPGTDASANIDPEGGDFEDLSGDNPKPPDTNPAAAPTTDGNPDEPGNGGGEEPGDGTDGKYKDASEGSYRVGDYEVKVVSAETGMPQFVKPPANLNDEYFFVTIKVYNRHEGKRKPYKSWTASARSTPKLVDNWEDAYPLEKSCEVEGRSVNSTIDPDESVKEILVFRDPKRVDKFKYLLLDLPGTAVGATENVCFKIPSEMIEEAKAPAEAPETKPKRGATKGPEDVVGEPAESKEDPLRAASTQDADDDGNPVDEVKEPPKRPSTGDDLLDQLSEQYGH